MEYYCVLCGGEVVIDFEGGFVYLVGYVVVVY